LVIRTKSKVGCDIRQLDTYRLTALDFDSTSADRMTRMNRILVIGATGNVGRQVISQLAATGGQVRAMTRNPDAAGLPPQVEVMRGDLSFPETLDRCLGGIDTVFLVWTGPRAAVAPASDRFAKHVRRIVFLSAPLKTPHPLWQPPNPHRVVFEQIEQLIEASGLEWTFLRPGMFAANALGWWLRRFATVMSCAGHMRSFPQPPSTKETSPPLQSASYARLATQGRNMF
jgi:NAD(P)-dependent dehydrogenase (short-subunit alcohol dehydrogenase family)